MAQQTFRGLIRWLVPSWLSTGDGMALCQSLAALTDAQIERVRLGLLVRFPSEAGESAMSYIERERGIPRGRSETLAHYAERALRWRWPRGHRVRGNAAALLEQVCQYWGGTWCQTIDRSGNRYTMTADGVVTVEHGLGWLGSARDATGAYPAAGWGRFWVAVRLPGARFNGVELVHEWPEFGVGGGPWEGDFDVPGTVIGMRDFTPDDAEAMRELFRGAHPWKPDGTRPEWLVVCIDPSAPPSIPDARWAVVTGGVHVPARNRAGFRYVALNRLRNVYAGTASDASLGAEVDGWSFAGDPASFPLSAELPDGTVYAGDPASFPTSVQFPDDGDLP